MKRRKSRSEPGTSPQEKKMTKSQSAHAVKDKVGVDVAHIDDLEEALSDAGSDVKSFRKASEEIKKLIEEINDLKKEGKQADSPEISERRIRCTLLFIILKKLNRLAHVRCKKHRDSTQEAKHKVDGLLLELQNLLYEVMHLKKEITKCLEFKSKDEEIDLVSEEEFYNDAPKEFSKPEVTKNDPHQRMLARLDWELEQRKRYASQKEEFAKKKDHLAQGIKAKKGFLDSLQPRLENILKATLPVQEYLNLPLDAQRAQYETAKYLPLPLYVLYVQSTAYHEACDKNLDIQIQGDLDAAKAVLEEKPIIRTNEESDSDQEGTEERTDKRRSKRRRMKEKSRQLEEKKALLKKHPLQVTIQFNFKSKNSLTLTFSFIPTLNIVTATPSLSLVEVEDKPVLASSNLLSPVSILNCLFPGDLGNRLPNPTNQFQLAKVGISEFLCIKEIGKPFLWAQKICGLEFLPDITAVTAKSQLSSSHMEETILAIRARILARLALQKQLAYLEECKIPDIKGDSSSLFPHKIQSVLKSWRPLTYADCVEIPFAKNLVTEDLISESDMFFTAQFQRNSTEILEAVVVVHQDYPVKPPLFSLCVKTSEAVISDEMTRLMEAEVNVHYQDLLTLDSPDNILTNQLKRLQMCFDIFIDCGYPNNLKDTEKLKSEKMLVRGLKGRERGLPFKYDSSLRIYIHR